MPRIAAGGWVVVALGLQLATAAPAGAQDVRWRSDYASARKEATAIGKPLLLDFGNEGCIWCRKLDATTFRDRGVAALLNERFIPVKVDTDHNKQLTEAAAIQSLPTILLVAPDGKIIGRHEGYADVAKMTTLLRQAAPQPTAIANSAPAPSGVVPASAVAARSPTADLLAQARADHDAGRYLACVERCDRIASGFPGSAEAMEARRLSASIVANPEKWKRVTGQLEADLATAHKRLDAALGR